MIFIAALAFLRHFLIHVKRPGLLFRTVAQWLHSTFSPPGGKSLLASWERKNTLSKLLGYWWIKWEHLVLKQRRQNPCKWLGIVKCLLTAFSHVVCALLPCHWAPSCPILGEGEVRERENDREWNRMRLCICLSDCVGCKHTSVYWRQVGS